MRSTSWATRSYAILCLAALVACVIVRAPTMLEEFKVPILDVELKLNAGYLLAFGPLATVFAVGLILWLDRDEGAARRAGAKNWIAVRLFPCLAAAFLSLQFFLLFAPSGQCPSFQRLRYLKDWSLGAFRPEYCMRLPPDVQERMPWIIDPPVLEGWMQVALPAVAFGLVIVDGARRRRHSTVPSLDLAGTSEPEGDAGARP